MREPVYVHRPTITVGTNAYETADALFTSAIAVAAGSEAVPYAWMMSPTIVSDTVTSDTDFDVVVFNANPSASTITAEAAHSIHADDQSKVLGIFKLDQAIVDGNCSIHYGTQPPLGVSGASGLIYFSVIVRGTPTFGAATHVRIAMPIMRQG